MKLKNTIWLYLSAMLVAVCFAACSDDDADGSSPITVTGVYLEDQESSVPDRLVEFVRLGQVIRIQGSGFAGMRKVYVNGYETYFNPVYVADNSMLLQVSSSTPITSAAEDVRNTIHFVKTGTDYVHKFIIRSASPAIQRIENTLPMAGETVRVFGSGLQEITQVDLPGGVVVTTGIESDEDGEYFTFVMPTGVTAGGAIKAIGANGEANSPNYFNYSSCMILNFDGKGTQGVWSWSETGSMLGAADKKDDNGKYTQRDERADDPAHSGRGKCMQLIPDRMLNNADGGIAATKTRCTEVWTAGTGNADDDWTWMYTHIPATTPVTEVAFQFDIYVPESNPWNNTGYIEVMLYNNVNMAGIGSDDEGQHVAFFVPWINNGAKTPYTTEGRWQTVTIPFSEWAVIAKGIAEDGKIPTFSDIVDARLAKDYYNFGMGIVNNDFKYKGVEVKSTLLHQKVYVDNWRIVPYQTTPSSDFPEVEE